MHYGMSKVETTENSQLRSGMTQGESRTKSKLSEFVSETRSSMSGGKNNYLG